MTGSSLVDRVKRTLYLSIRYHLHSTGLGDKPQQALAKKLGLHQPDVSHLLAGKLDRFSVDLLLRTAERLGVEFEFDPKADAIKAREELVERLRSGHDAAVNSVIKSLHELRSPLAFEWEGRKPDFWYLQMDIAREIEELRR